MARPKIRTTNTWNMDDMEQGQKYCGYIMHKIKSVRCRMRWGELWTIEKENGPNQCNIILYKFDITNPKPAQFMKKDLKQKAIFSFSEEDFCGLEKGMQSTLGGMRRYICIILKDQHIILQDAVIAMSDTDHDVIKTWYEKITSTMHYMYRWKILGFNEPKFLHVSRKNTCECFSVHKTNTAQKGKLLLDHLYNTSTLDKVEEEPDELYNGTTWCYRVSFCDASRAADVKVSLLLETGKRLNEVLSRIAYTQQKTNGNGGFDLLSNINPNLVKVKPTSGKVSLTKSLTELSTDKKSPGNNYIFTGDGGSLARKQPNGLEQHNGMVAVYPPERDPLESLYPQSDLNSYANAQTTSLMTENSTADSDIDPTTFSPTNPFSVPRGPRHHHDNRPRLPPRDPTDPKKEVCDTGMDTGYHTGEAEELSRLRITTNHVDTLGSAYVNLTDMSVVETPPAVPARDPSNDTPDESAQDIFQVALSRGNLPPCEPERVPDYVNSLALSVTIDMLLDQREDDVVDTLGLTYATYTAIRVGLESDSATGGDWRGLAGALEMTLDNVHQIEGTVRNHPILYPATIVMFHWQRTDSPYPYTRRSLRGLLAENLLRLDLAQQINLDENEENIDESNRHNQGM